MDNSLDERMQRQNLVRLLEALRGLPLHHVKVIYAGDNGHVTHCKVSVSPMGTDHHLSTVTVEQVRPAVSPSSEADGRKRLPGYMAHQVRKSEYVKNNHTIMTHSSAPTESSLPPSRQKKYIPPLPQR